MSGVRIVALLLIALLTCLILPARAADDASFLHDGDVWVFHGDSVLNLHVFPPVPVPAKE